ncbi:diguanylate cyclase [Shewanella sp.]|uniref:sensor domain-containing diguanylate cyclase n=1 Tax=Shewanella sp. TaxID=50422 RepID=UPI003A97F3BC
MPSTNSHLPPTSVFGHRLWLNRLLVQQPLLSDVLLLLLWLGLWRVSALMEYAPHASVWFPPAGVSFAAFLLLGLRAIPSVAISCMLATFWEATLYQSDTSSAQLIMIGCLFAFAHIVPYYAAASLLRVFVHNDEQKLPRMILAFMIIGPLASLSAAYCIQVALHITGAITDESHLLWLPLWIGDLIGIIVLTPLAIGLISRIYPTSGIWLSEVGLRQTPGSIYTFLVKLLLALVLSSLIMVAAARLDIRELAFAIFFIGIAQMWIVYTETPLRSAVSIALLSGLTAILVKWLDLGEDALIYQFSMSVLAASTYFGLLIPVLASNNERLQQIAYKDPLTKVLSRQHFFHLAQQEVQRANFYQQPVCIAVFDIDHFKAINDTYGHSAGDGALKFLTAEIDQRLGPAELLGRFGGDEFMLLLPATSLAQAQSKLSTIFSEVSQLELGQLELSLRCSVGVTEVKPEDSLIRAFERADCLLFTAKKQGRNQVVASNQLKIDAEASRS